MKKSDVNILIVDDDASFRESLEEAIRRLGFRPLSAAKASEALKIARLRKIHSAIIDCMLPLKNGVELAAELRKDTIKSNKIRLISGVFRDPSFIQDALKRSGANEFLSKPIDIRSLYDQLKEELTPLVDAPKVSLYSLLAKPFASNRERKKSLELVDEVSGYDLPFILCILMDANSSGHLNMVNNKGELFGVTFCDGKILRVDSADGDARLSILLLNHGFVTSEDFDELIKLNSKGELLKSLLENSMVSPHAIPIIRQEIISSEIRRLVHQESLQINFSQDRSLKGGEGEVEITAITPLIHELIDTQIPVDWLRKFYSVWKGHPILEGPTFSADHQVMALPIMDRVKGLLTLLQKSPTLSEILSQGEFDEGDLWKAIHLLSLRRLIVFAEEKRSESLSEIEERLKSMEKAFDKKNPVEVFQFFGLNSNASVAEINTVFTEFAKSNHPDKMSKSIPDNLKELNQRVFSMVSDAHDILVNEEKRGRFMLKLQQKEADRQLKAEDLRNSAVVNLKRGQSEKALEAFRKSQELYEAELTQIYIYWAELKSGRGLPSKSVKPILEALKKMEAENGSPEYYFVQGLCYKYLGNLNKARESFTQAIKTKSDFLEARRELSQLKGSDTKNDLNFKELFTGDLNQVFSQLFKKRK